MLKKEVSALFFILLLILAPYSVIGVEEAVFPGEKDERTSFWDWLLGLFKPGNKITGMAVSEEPFKDAVNRDSAADSSPGFWSWLTSLFKPGNQITGMAISEEPFDAPAVNAKEESTSFWSWLLGLFKPGNQITGMTTAGGELDDNNKITQTSSTTQTADETPSVEGQLAEGIQTVLINNVQFTITVAKKLNGDYTVEIYAKHDKPVVVSVSGSPAFMLIPKQLNGESVLETTFTALPGARFDIGTTTGGKSDRGGPSQTPADTVAKGCPPDKPVVIGDTCCEAGSTSIYDGKCCPPVQYGATVVGGCNHYEPDKAAYRAVKSYPIPDECGPMLYRSELCCKDECSPKQKKCAKESGGYAVFYCNNQPNPCYSWGPTLRHLGCKIGDGMKSDSSGATAFIATKETPPGSGIWKTYYCQIGPDCKEKWIETSEISVTPKDDECRSAADCDKGEICTDGQCVDAGAGVCTPSCSQNEVCEDGSCIPSGAGGDSDNEEDDGNGSGRLIGKGVAVLLGFINPLLGLAANLAMDSLDADGLTVEEAVKDIGGAGIGAAMD